MLCEHLNLISFYEMTQSKKNLNLLIFSVYSVFMVFLVVLSIKNQIRIPILPSVTCIKFNVVVTSDFNFFFLF